MAYLIARKLGMTRVFTVTGNSVPVTVLEAGPCVVTQVKTVERDGYSAVQVGFGTAKHPSKPHLGHLAAAKSQAKWLREFRVASDQLPAVGDTQTVASFELGQTLRIRGTSKGKGFEGTVTRHHFSRGPETHGSDQHRQPGAIGSGFPQRVFAGMRMAGHLGHQGVTIRAARVHAIHPEQHLLVVTGPVPGPAKGLVTVETLE